MREKYKEAQLDFGTGEGDYRVLREAIWESLNNKDILEDYYGKDKNRLEEVESS